MKTLWGILLYLLIATGAGIIFQLILQFVALVMLLGAGAGPPAYLRHIPTIFDGILVLLLLCIAWIIAYVRKETVWIYLLVGVVFCFSTITLRNRYNQISQAQTKQELYESKLRAEQARQPERELFSRFLTDAVFSPLQITQIHFLSPAIVAMGSVTSVTPISLQVIFNNIDIEWFDPSLNRSFPKDSIWAVSPSCNTTRLSLEYPEDQYANRDQYDVQTVDSHEYRIFWTFRGDGCDIGTIREFVKNKSIRVLKRDTQIVVSTLSFQL